MKKIHLIIIVILFSQKTSAQLAPLGTTWIYEYSSFDIGVSYYDRLEIKATKDTLIDNNMYSQFIGDETNYFTRIGTKIYYYYNYEKLLYFDFDVNVGDTLYIDYLKKYISPDFDSLFYHYPVYIKDISYHKNYGQTDSLKFISLNKKIKIGNLYDGIISEKILTHLNGRSSSPFSYDIFGEPPFEGGIVFKCYTEPNGYSFKMVNDCNKVGIKEVDKSSIEIYPNPFINKITFESNSKSQLQVFDSFGRVLYGTLKPSSKQTIDLSNLEPNIYFLKIQTDNNKTIVKKLVKL